MVSPLQLGGNGREFGQVKTFHNLAFMLVYGAGHTAPNGQPEASLDLFNRWLAGEWKTY